ncbi:MAG: insulinase family protein [Proteobacteria bacterium]|nr:insulinase family protein [Pseudomonadota bacterium]
MMRILVTLLAAGLSAPAQAQMSAPKAPPAKGAARMIAPKVPALVEKPLPGDPMGVTIHRLANGLTVYLSPAKLEPKVTAWIVVRTGARNDPDDSTGMAHYLEHMLFKGSGRLGTLDFKKEKEHLDKITALYESLFKTTDADARKKIYAEIDKENAQASKYEVPNELDRLYSAAGFEGLNAFTSEEITAYVTAFPANRAELWAKTESDRFAAPVFRLFQSELEAVYEEKNRSMDNPNRSIGEALNKVLYKDHPYGRTVLGSVEHLKNPSLKKMYQYFDDRYRPGNMAIVMSGDFERERMLALIEGTFGQWKARPIAQHKPRPVKPLKGVERAEVKFEAEQKVIVAWPTVPNNHPDHDAVLLMNMVFDNSQSGILNLYLNQQQKVKESGASPDFRDEAGAWEVWAVPKGGQTLEEAEALLIETVEKLKAGDFADSDLKAVVTNFEVSEKGKLESNWSRVEDMATSWAEYQEWPFSASLLERMRKLTKADVVRVARQYLGANRAVAYRREGKPEHPSIAKPGFTKIDIDPSRKSPFFAELEKLPTIPLAPQWLEDGRDFVRKEYPWGKFYAAKNPVNDLFSLTFDIERGRRHDRSLCAAMDLLDLSGAGEMSADAFKKALYSLGATMGLGCGEYESTISVSGPEENFDKALDLVFARLESPNVAPDTLKKMIDVQIGAHKDNKKNPGYITHALKAFAMRGDKSDVLNELTDKELQALDETKLKDLLKHLLDYERRAFYVGVRGVDQAAARLGAGRTKFLPAPKREPLRYVETDKPKVLLTHRDMVQSRVGIFSSDTIVDPSRRVDEEFYDNYMGGGMNGVIFQEVREARSLAYSASGGYSTGGKKGDQNALWAAAGCQADKTIEASTLLRDLLQKMPASAERFSESKQALEQQYRTDFVNFRSVPGAVAHWEDLGIGAKDPRPERFKKVQAYQFDDLKKFAAVFEKKSMTLHILGPKDKIDLEALKKLGDYKEIAVDQLFPY